MCDALSRNMPKELETIVGNCLLHGRRQFVDVATDFPQECLYVLEILKEVYKNDAEAKRRQMSDHQRLQFHKRESGPRMDELNRWLAEQFEQRKVEPNSNLGEAINYMLTHWDKLTLFLKQPGAPLDKNYDSYCTSLSGSHVTSWNRRLSDSLCPWLLTGWLSPTGS